MFVERHNRFLSECEQVRSHLQKGVTCYRCESNSQNTKTLEPTACLPYRTTAARLLTIAAADANVVTGA